MFRPDSAGTQERLGGPASAGLGWNRQSLERSRPGAVAGRRSAWQTAKAAYSTSQEKAAINRA